MYKAFTLLILLLSLFSIPLFGEQNSTEVEVKEAKEKPVSTPEVAAEGGEILFFPEKVERTKEGRFQVHPGDIVTVCIKLRNVNSFIKKLKREATGFKLILEDNESPPNAIIVQEGEESKYIREDDKGCYRTAFKIPEQISQSIYQVADLLFRTNYDDYYSVREYLYRLSIADELEVKNKNTDLEAPQLINIVSFQKPVNKKKIGSRSVSIQIKEDFQFEDSLSGIDPSSLHIFYRLLEDGDKAGIYEAKCSLKSRKLGKFSCKLKIVRIKPEWDLGTLILELDSIYLRDNAGNLLVIQDPRIFKEKAGENPVQFEFVDKLPESQGDKGNKTAEAQTSETPLKAPVGSTKQNQEVGTQLTGERR